MTERKSFNLPGKPPGLPFSDAVLAGDTLYISGRIGFDPGTMKVPAEPEAEARNLLTQFQQVLRLAGMSMSDLVFLQIFCPQVALFDRFNAVYREFFSADLPARAFIGSGPLLFDARFEMVGIAVRR